MRFYYDVEIYDRKTGSIVQRQSTSLLMFEKRLNDTEVCLYLHNQQNMQRYQISNIEHVFTKSSKFGEITIIVKQPSHKLIIQNDKLDDFLQTLSCLTGTPSQCMESAASNLVRFRSHFLPLERQRRRRPSQCKESSTLAMNHNNLLKRRRKEFHNKLSWRRRDEFSILNFRRKNHVIVSILSEYPKSFPKTTDYLNLSGLDRTLFDKQILQLYFLRILDLSHNKISYIPKEMGTLFLQQLFLSYNNLGKTPKTEWEWLDQTAIKNNLVVLDISSNSLTDLPLQIKYLNALENLDVCQNMLTHLPHNIEALKNLKVLNVAKNQLPHLPVTILNMRLQSLDVADNPFIPFSKISVYGNKSTTGVKISSLVESSAKIILNSRITYDGNILPYPLVEYLDEAKRCFVCKILCFDYYVTNLLNATLPKVKIKPSKSTNFKFEIYFCSMHCAERLNLFS